MSSHVPVDEYRSRREQRLAVASRERSITRGLSWARLVAFGTALVLLPPVLFGSTVGWGWLAPPLVVFLTLVVAHDRVITRGRRAEYAASYYEVRLDRLAHRPDESGADGGSRFLDPEHPYAADLDLFGPGSLFESIDTTRTVPGGRTLAAWLAEPAEPAAILRRQQAVAELKARTDLREALAVLGQERASGIDPDPLRDWATRPIRLHGGAWPAVGGVLALANLTTLAVWLLPQVAADGASARGLFDGSLPFWISVLLSVAFAAPFHLRARRVLAAVDRPAAELEVLATLFSRIEEESFQAPLLVELRAALRAERGTPSARIRRLARIVQTNDSRANMVFAPLAGLLLLGTQLAFSLERWRAESGSDVARWLETLGAVEALAALATLAWEHPEDPFPEVAPDGPILVADQLTHPLLPASSAVRNDVRLGGEAPQLWLVSGSNMSGKSTLLRAVGVNVVLALAGAPVRARRMRLSPMSIGACMRVQDSLQAGLSHFYAEIRRLSSIVEIGRRRNPPLLFLLDEVLHGTNSHDRRVGADALIRELLNLGAIGLVTTHDLALAGIADELAPRSANVHFADELDGDRIRFDYKVRPGVVRHSNALALMRRVGLAVGSDPRRTAPSGEDAS